MHARDLADRLRRAGCVYAEQEAEALRVRFADPDALESAVLRREAGAPLEHVLGYADLAGIRVRIAAPVFVPRRRTDWLVDLAVQRLRTGDSHGPVLDLGCGAGAFAAVLADRAPGVEVLAADVDPDAVACARTNGTVHGFAVYQGDWLRALPRRYRGELGLVVAYLPHVPTADLPLLPADQRKAEPRLAVDGGHDGLDPLRAVLAQLGDWLAADGLLLTLLADRQAAAAVSLAERAGWSVSVHGFDADVVLGIGRQVGEITSPAASSDA